jgi:(4S)-4-hydroxy-5-phosphonooxypentane-2,3-dione isomerase
LLFNNFTPLKILGPWVVRKLKTSCFAIVHILAISMDYVANVLNITRSLANYQHVILLQRQKKSMIVPLRTILEYNQEINILTMTTTCVHVWVKPDKTAEFIAATLDNHNQSVLEEGNLRFDLLQDLKEPNRFLIYEAYESEEQATAHKNTVHYLIWKDLVAPLMDKPREGIKYKVLGLQK